MGRFVEQQTPQSPPASPVGPEAPKQRPGSAWRLALPLTLAVMMGIVGFRFGREPALLGLFEPGYWRELGRVGRTMLLVHHAHVEPQAAAWPQLAEGALQGMMQGLDRYSAYLPREALAEFEETTRQHYVGVGIELSRLPDRITINRVFPGGSAEEEGIQPGDQIIGVAGSAAENTPLGELVERIRGAAGTTIELRIFRPAKEATLDFVLTRREVRVPRVVDVELAADEIGYLRISQFGERTPQEFRDALDDLTRRGARALIIDLRNNPGGLLHAALDIAAEFSRPGDLLVTTESRHRGERRHVAPSSAPGRDIPLAILLNPGSASAAEVLAGALRDHDRAVLIGERSVGKGSVQSIYTLSEGDGLRLTTARYLTPRGRNLHEVGLDPDIEVDLSDDDYRKIDLVRTHLAHMGPERFESQFGFAPPPDPQRDAAVDALRRRLAIRPATTLLQPPRHLPDGFPAFSEPFGPIPASAVARTSTQNPSSAP